MQTAHWADALAPAELEELLARMKRAHDSHLKTLWSFDDYALNAELASLIRELRRKRQDML